jgi:hypothetical protein
MRHSISTVVLVGIVIFGCSSSSGGGTTAATGAAIGEACTADKDCQVGGFCKTDDPGGQCEKKCTSDADCGSGNVCAQDEGELKCYRACKTIADCPRPGYGCDGKDERNPANLFCDHPSDSAEDAGSDG